VWHAAPATAPATLPAVSPRRIRLHRRAHHDAPGLDIAITRALLTAVAAGRVGETIRLYRPGREVAFGRHDTLTPGYAAAVAAARGRGFTPVLRLAGGRAAVFHETTLAFSWTIPDREPTGGIHARFAATAELFIRAFRRLGIAAAVGPVPGEYCPGAYSINLAGRLKVVGLGQRLVRGAAHVGGVVVVDDPALVRGTLVPVYAALGIPWNPDTVGALTDAVPGVTPADVATAVLAELADLAEVDEAPLPDGVLEAARTLRTDHVAPGPEGEIAPPCASSSSTDPT